jgi:hypothetical protein
MIDRLPTEILATELVRFCDKDDAFNLMLSCRTVHNATSEHFQKSFKPLSNLINLENPVFYDQCSPYTYNTWIFRKSRECGTKNYYQIPGKYVKNFTRDDMKKSAKL